MTHSKHPPRAPQGCRKKKESSQYKRRRIEEIADRTSAKTKARVQKKERRKKATREKRHKRRKRERWTQRKLKGRARAKTARERKSAKKRDFKNQRREGAPIASAIRLSLLLHAMVNAQCRKDSCQ